MRIMGVDYGDVRIGVALSDELGMTAQTYEVIDCRRIRDPIVRLCEIARAQQVDEIVVGLPRNMNGSYGERAEISRVFADKLAEATRLSVVLVDERLSTVSAERVLLEADVSRARRKQVVDKVAAAVILQSYLDTLEARRRLR